MFCASCIRRGWASSLLLCGAALFAAAASRAATPATAGCARAQITAPGIVARAASPAIVPALPGSSPVVLPAHCRIVGKLRPVAGSRIGFELWLPRRARWNGRMVMLGNGGYSSRLPLPVMAAELARGSAVVATDTGHRGDDPGFALGHPQAIADWGWRAVHASAQAAQRVIRRYYRRAAAYRYFNGCSTGGHQAMMEAQRFPGDFDGIVAGAPGSNRVTLNAAFLWQYLSNHRRGEDAAPILGGDDLALLQQGSFAACHADNGASAGGLASDPWLNDPAACRFDPAVLACAPGQAAACLTPAKVAAARAMYRGAPDPRNGARATFPWLPGSEAGWVSYLSDGGHPDRPARADFWRVWAFGDPAWSWWTFDYGAGLAQVRSRLGPTIDAVDPDLSRFRARGGKLLQYHGLADPVVSPLDTMAYYRAVERREPVNDWYRLFLAPGMGHCGGGPGFSQFATQPVIECWVEQGVAPDRIVATRGAGDPPASRPLCPFPMRATYCAGEPDRAESFTCTMPTSAPDRTTGERS